MNNVTVFLEQPALVVTVELTCRVELNVILLQCSVSPNKQLKRDNIGQAYFKCVYILYKLLIILFYCSV